MGPRTSIRGNVPIAFKWLASGLLQWGRGLPSAETYYLHDEDDTDTTRFNGAADFHPRKRDLSPKGHRASCRFNGAADFHPRKLDAKLDTIIGWLASMGPRTSIRGNCR